MSRCRFAQMAKPLARGHACVEEVLALWKPGLAGGDAIRDWEQSGVPSEEASLTVLHLNIRGYVSHIAEVTALLRTMPSKPSLVVLNETFLTRVIEDIQLEGYALLARRDRRDQWGGGVAVFIIANQFTMASVVEVSEEAERVWIIVHSDRGPFLISSWYRPPAPGEVASIHSCETELQLHRRDVRGTLVIGDINVHSVRWLEFSSGESPEGSAMHEACQRSGLRQIVKAPTRGDNLLDLAMTDIGEATASMVAAIADHRGVLVTIPFTMPKVAAHDRQIWHFRDADWVRLREQLAEEDWKQVGTLPPDEGATMLTEIILKHAAECIPKRTARMQKSTHPWLTKRAEEAVRSKLLQRAPRRHHRQRLIAVQS